MARFNLFIALVLVSNSWDYGECACRQTTNQTICDRFEDISTISPKYNVSSLIVHSQDTPRPCNYPLLSGFYSLEYFENRNGHIPFVESPCFEDLILIKTMSLAFNKIVTVDFAAFNHTPMHHVHLNGNYIRRASLEGIEMWHLRSLNLSENLLTTFAMRTVNAWVLEGLELEKNKIVNFKIESETVWKLLLGGNSLQSFSGDDLNCPNLHTLTLNDNSLRAITAEMLKNVPKLGLIILSDNLLHQVEFPSAHQLNYISMRSNRIRSIGSFGFGESPRTRSLDLSNNRLYELQPNWRLVIANMFLFACDNCHIHYIDSDFIPRIMPSVQSLFLRDNYIQSLELLRTEHPLNVAHLDMSFNFIEAIARTDLASVPKLTVLYLHFNKIKAIEDRAFEQMVSLRELNLDHNCIHQLPDHFFQGSMRSIDLSYNLLTRLPLPSDAGHQLPELGKLSVLGNPIQCSCYSLILDWMSTRSLTQYETLSLDYKSDGSSPSCIVTNANCSTEYEPLAAHRRTFRDKNRSEDHMYGRCGVD